MSDFFSIKANARQLRRWTTLEPLRALLREGLPGKRGWLLDLPRRLLGVIVSLFLCGVLVIAYAYSIFRYLPFVEILFPGFRRQKSFWFPSWLPSLHDRDSQNKPRVIR